MAHGDLTTRGKCNSCQAVIAWHGGAHNWKLYDPKRDPAGEVVRIEVKNGKGRTAKRPVADPDQLHTCEGVLRGLKREGEIIIDPETGRPATTLEAATKAVEAAKLDPATGNPPTYDPGETEAIPTPAAEAIDYGRIRAEVVTILDEYGVKPPEAIIRVEHAGGTTKVEGIAHPRLPRLIRLLAQRKHAYCHGPSGTGKTFAAGQAADALSLRHAVMSMPGIQSPARIFGFETAKGTYVPTIFAEYFEHGGVLVADEMDRMIPQVASSLNSSLANGEAVFGGRSVNAHEDFCMIATGNTDMRGATMDYTAAQPQDYSLAARFAFVEWPNDPPTERLLIRAIMGPGATKALLKFFDGLRTAIKRAALEKILCGPRESMRVAEDIAAGTSVVEAVDSWVRRGLDVDVWDSIVTAAGDLPVIEQGV